MAKKVSISVQYLVERMLRVGNLEAGQSLNEAARARAQSDYERFREDEYRFKVPLSYTYQHNGASVELRGEVAGLFTSRAVTRVETIELLDEPLETFDDALDIIAWGRAKILAYIVAEEQAADSIEIIITWYQRKEFTTVERRQTVSFGELHDYFESLLTGYMEWAGLFSSWSSIRDPSIEKLDFPFTPYRPGQRAMMAAVYTTIKNDRQILIQAPTGIGKTLASLYPAIKALGDGFTEKIFYCTARTTGRDVAEKALVQLQRKGLRVKVVSVTAKEKICARKESPRECDDCRYAKGYHSRIKDALHHGFKHDLVTRAIIERIAGEFLLCPFEFSLDLALTADIIIGDYNYVFDPNVYLKRFFNDTCTDAFSFLIDEAHNLVDRARGMYSAVLRRSTFAALSEKIKDDLPDIFNEMESVLSLLAQAEKKCAGTPVAKTAKEPPRHLFSPLRKVLRTIEDWIGRKSRAFYKKELIEFYFDIKHFVSMGELFDEHYASIEEPGAADFTITLFCVNPALLLARRFDHSKSAVLFSATISPIHYFQDILGLKKTGENLMLPSPFPKENMRLLCADRVSTKYFRREFTLGDVVAYMAALVHARPGKLYGFLSIVCVYGVGLCSLCRKKSTYWLLYAAATYVGARAHRIYQKFDEPSGRTLVGFAVMGGVFGEGIDLMGERLSGAIITGVGLPGLSPERDCIREYFDKRECGFEYAYMYPGMNKVLQAAGRVIRSETDKGVIMLIDERFATSRYYSLFPKEWRPKVVRGEADIRRIAGSFALR